VRLANASLKVWGDERIRIGAKWNNAIEEELRASHILILLLNPKWIESDYCRKEYTVFEQTESSRSSADYVAPILIMDVEN
jgi:short-subunit dehydrogenase